jgi:hypothetical protein
MPLARSVIPTVRVQFSETLGASEILPAAEGQTREGLKMAMGVNYGPGLHAGVGQRVDRWA